MGSSCSRVQKARRSVVTQNVTNIKSHENGKEAPSQEEQEEAQEEDDDLDALSPISAITKVGSARTRGLSAASTVLPGTSISLSPAMDELTELPSCRPLPDLTGLPEESRNLLMGRCPAHTPDHQDRNVAEVPLLVLCNGEDAHLFFRREVEEKVVPELRESCFGADATLGVFAFGHQSIPGGADFRHLIVRLARNLLNSRNLITMTIFGGSSTRLYPPDIVFQSDFDSAVSRMSSGDSREVVHCAYQADVNAVKPCYRLRSDDASRQRVLRVLEGALDDELKDVYLTSVFEDVLRVLLERGSDGVRQRSFLVRLEQSSARTAEKRSVGREDVRVRDQLSAWEDGLPDENKFSFFEGGDGESWQELSADEGGERTGNSPGGLRAGMRRTLERVLGERNDDELPTGMDPQLREELLHQQCEVQGHLRTFQDRPELLSSLMSYVAGPHNHPLVVHGRQGRGKSALLAVATVLRGALFPEAPVLHRSCGTSPESCTQEQILRSVCEQIALLYGEHPSLASRSIAEHNSYFSGLLRRAGRPERPLVVVLDGLDQVEEQSGRSLKWFPALLPPHVKLVLALRDGSSELQELQERLLGEKSAFLEVPDLEVEDALSIVRNQMRGGGRRLTQHQTNFARICLTDNAYPRYAHAFARAACAWNTLSVPEHFWSRHSLPDVFADHLSHLSAVVGPNLLRRFLAVLATPKHGLMLSEVLDLLSGTADPGVVNGLAGDPLLPLFLCHHLSFALRTCHRRGRTFLQFAGQLFRKLCRGLVGGRVLQDTLGEVLEYFQDDPRTGAGIKTNHKHQRWRSLEEVTHLRIRLNLPVRRHFFDPAWLFERVCQGDPYLLLEEIKMYKRQNPDDREFEVLRRFLQLSAHALRMDGRQLFSQLYGRVRGFYVEPENSVRYPSVKELYKASAAPPVPTFLSQGPCLKTLVELQKQQPGAPASSINESEPFDEIMWLDTEGRYLVTWCSAKGEVTAWNVVQMKRMASLGDLTSVEGLVSMHHEAEVLLLHHGRIELYDLAKGSLKVQMVELVDATQGAVVLQGGKYVLAVSAARDEILRFETYSGHVVSRIVTEGKRRLDRLIVSGNGEVCACGDSVRKPYPLLAWNIQSGQMLREFSMPHREYVVRCTRMDTEGSALYALTKDLLGSSPDSLVAYDLCTGAVLWEVHSDIIALDVCLRTGTLVAATQEGHLCGWRLNNGEMRFKRSIPAQNMPDRLESTPDESFFTWDSSTRDRCLRLWDTVDGTCLVTFTADYDIADCALSRDGNSVGFILCGRETPAAIRLRTPGLYSEN